MRRVIGAGASAVSFLLIGFLAAPAWAQGPVGYWKGDETPPPAGNTAIDSSGTFPGTYTNGATTVQPRPGTPPSFRFANPGCMTFTGGAQPAAHVSIPDAPALRVTGDFTIAFWMYKTGNPGDWARMVGKGQSGPRTFGVWEWAGGDGRIKFQQYNAGGGSILELDSTMQTNVNQWYHIACMIQGSAARMYINGALHVSGTRSGTPGTDAEPFTIAAAAFHQGFQGQLDDVRLYGRALSAAEITLLSQGYSEVATPVLTGTGGMMQVQLSWTPNPDPNVQSYTIERANSAAGPWTAIVTGYSGNSYTDTSVIQSPPDYFYRVIAVGLGSATSNVVGPLTVQPFPPRFDDHEEGLFGDRCNCASTGAASPLGVAAALALMALGLILFRP